MLRHAPNGPCVHPFRDFAKVSHRGCSLNLTRRIVDFSAERSFLKTSEALKEHYNIEVSVHAIDRATDRVCRQAKEFNSISPKGIEAAPTLISEVDGSMIPIVETEAGTGGDKRKTRKCFWKEIRVSTARRPDETSCYYCVGVGEPLTIGCMMYQCCQFKGLNEDTHIHAVSDGARWIADQYELHFGQQHTFVRDFYHACDYLSEAGDLLCLDDKSEWMSIQKQKLKQGKAHEIISELKSAALEEDERLRSIIGYLQTREEKGQLDYQEVIERELPIGSGEVESAHRHLLQKRLKIPGAWWRLSRAEEMAQLRALRANDRWNEFWNQQDSCAA